MAPITPLQPSPLPPWARWGIRALPFVWGIAQDLLDHPGTVQTNSDLVWRRLVLHWSRGPGGVGAEDDATCSFDIANITNSDIDGSWTVADYQAAELIFNTNMLEIANFQSPDYKLYQGNWYRMQFANPMTAARRFVPSGPPEHVTVFNIPGASVSESLPAQVACVVTEKTSIPRHWGRFYLPGYTEGESGGVLGRFNAGIVDGTGNAIWNLYKNLQDAQFFPVVVSTQVDNVLVGSLVGVSSIRVDDVPDIIRRRRLRLSSHTFTK